MADDVMNSESSDSSTQKGEGNKPSDQVQPIGPPSDSVMSEEKIRSAVSFLRHPRVRNSPKDQQVTFLKSKGLNDLEIKEAYQRADVKPTSVAPVTAYNQHPLNQPESNRHTASPPIFRNINTPYQQLNKINPRQAAIQQHESRARWSQVLIFYSSSFFASR